jgi:hypothetical protein
MFELEAEVFVEIPKEFNTQGATKVWKLPPYHQILPYHKYHHRGPHPLIDMCVCPHFKGDI